MKLRLMTDAETAETTLKTVTITAISPCTPGYTSPTGMLDSYT